MAGWTPIPEPPKAAPDGWTSVQEQPKTFEAKLEQAARGANYGAGEFANPEHPAHAMVKQALADISSGNYAKGAHGLIGAAAEFLKPTLPATIGTAPITSALGAVGGFAGAKAGEALATKAGATSEQAALAGDIAGIAGGAGAGKLATLPSVGAELAPKLYKSALKPSTTIPDWKIQNIIKTGLGEGVPVSAGGLEKLGGMIDDINQQIADKIKTAADQGVTVNKFATASRLGSTAQEFSSQVAPAKDLATIAKTGNEFLRNQPNEIPADVAQAMKQGTYQQIRKSYGQLSSASIESQKALARGLKEELAAQIPEIGDLNAKESRFIDLDATLERAVNRIGNHQIIGIGTPILAGGIKAATGSTAAAGAIGVLKAIIDDPMVKSKLAIAMAQRGVPINAAAQRLAAYSAALAGASSAAPPAGQQNTGGTE